MISTNSDTTLFGTQGTRIFIGRESFQHLNGDDVNDSIKIELREFYDKTDMILAELSTQPDGKLLETAGMLHIKTTSMEKT